MTDFVSQQFTDEELAERSFWLIQHPQFEEKPATILEFLGPDYLNIESGVRPGIKKALVDVFGEEVSPDRIARVQKAMLTGAIGIGKGHTDSTPLLTPSGWKVLRDINVGDQVIGSDGQPTYVTGVYPRGYLETYRVTFSDGAWVHVDADHLWNVQSPSQKARRGRWSTVSTVDLIAAGLKNSYGQRKWHIPVVQPVEFDPVELPLDPYLVGAFIGDGGLTQSSPILTTVDVEILDRVASVAPVAYRKTGQCSYRFSDGYTGGCENSLTRAMREVGLWGHGALDKFIPSVYLRGSIQQRLDLLRGLLDTDGYYNAALNVTQFYTVSQRLRDDVISLVRGLGGVASWTSKETGYETSYNVTIRIRVNPFWLTRKSSQWRPMARYTPTRMIESIEPAGVQNITCISVKAEDQLYVTKDYIVTHNSTFASIALPYMVHWVLCLKDPQGFFGLLPGSRIAFMMMSTSETQAKDVIFGDIDARIKHSPWFKKYLPDAKLKTRLKFAKDIWILPGDSKETTFEGYNILGGILDEMDSHTVTKDKDYADVGYKTIEGRMRSRFGKRGLVIPIGQMKKATGFAARKCAEFMTDTDAFVVRMTIWESLGWDWIGDDPQSPYPFLNPDGSHKSFYYDYKRRMFIPKGVGDLLPDSNTILEIPDYYRKDFQNGPESSLKDLAGIPPAVTDPFISLVDKIELCRDRWIESTFPVEYSELEEGADLSIFSPVTRSSARPEFAPWFTNREVMDLRRRCAHVDMAYSGEGDAAGIAMGHVKGLTEDEEGEEQPIFKFDFLMRIKAPSGTEIFIPDIRKVLYYLRDELRFRLKKVTYDGFESQESIQQLRKRRFDVEKVSMDKSKLPYEDLREAIYGGRCEFPPYITEWSRGEADSDVEIAIKELSELHDDGRKIDHPPTGSKDLADAMAGVVTELIGDRRYRRGVHSLSVKREERAEKTGTDDILDSMFREQQGKDALFADAKGYPKSVVPSSDGGILIPLHLRR